MNIKISCHDAGQKIPSNAQFPCSSPNSIDATKMTSDTVNKFAAATVPAFKCPKGTKMHLLNLGTLEVDEGWYACSSVKESTYSLLTDCG